MSAPDADRSVGVRWLALALLLLVPGCGDDERALAEHAWYAGNAAGVLHAVAQKRPNTRGLHDLHGNCWEWCADRFGEDYYQQLTQRPEQRQRGTRKSSS